MNSYEERLRALKLYIKLRKRAQATIRELGYPKKNAVKQWHVPTSAGLANTVGAAPA